MNITITPDVQKKMFAWTQLAQGEVSGLGLVRKTTNTRGIVQRLCVDHLELLDQECNQVHTSLDETAVARFCHEATEMGRGGDVRFWWHSHVDMDVYFSGKDRRTIEKLTKEDFLLSMVTNKEGDYRLRLDVQPNDDQRYVMDDLNYKLAMGTIPDELEEEYHDKVDQSIVYNIAHHHYNLRNRTRWAGRNKNKKKKKKKKKKKAKHIPEDVEKFLENRDY